MSMTEEEAVSYFAWAEQEAAPDRGWVFTFGPDHRMTVYDAYTRYVDGSARGVPMGGRFVFVTGSEEDARRKILEFFGPGSWAAQYPADAEETAAMIARLGLRELEL